MDRRGNPNWGKPVPFGPVVPTVTSFEEAVKELELQPDQYLHSTRLLNDAGTRFQHFLNYQILCSVAGRR